MEILHKKGKENVIVDALSQRDKDVTTYKTSILMPH